MTDQQILTAVEGAIQYILNGCVGSYEVDGRQTTYLDLESLLERRQKLYLTLKRQANGVFDAVEFRSTRPRIY